MQSLKQPARVVKKRDPSRFFQSSCPDPWVFRGFTFNISFAEHRACADGIVVAQGAPEDTDVEIKVPEGNDLKSPVVICVDVLKSLDRWPCYSFMAI